MIYRTLRDTLKRPVPCLLTGGRDKTWWRWYSTRTPPQKPMSIFDRLTKQRQKQVASENKEAHLYDYLKDEMGYRLADRVFDIKRKFQVGVEVGCSRGYVAHHLSSDVMENLFMCDSSLPSLEKAKLPPDIPTTKLLVDEEQLPFRENSVDIFVSSLAFHWINDLPGTFLRMLYCLKEDGVLMASMFGGQTIYELRCSLQLAEIEREGGFAPHVSPFTQPSDIAALLTRCGFRMITIDCDEIKINYPSMFEVMFDLQGMAENNASWNRKPHINRDSLLAAASIYKEMYGNEDGSVPATFQIFYFIGWKPHASQPKPIERGSGTFSLKDIKDLEKAVKNKIK